MVNLEYRIGELSINPSKLRFEGEDPRNAGHKFVTEAIDNVIFMYVAEEAKHTQVADKFNIPEKRRVGGGSCYLNARSYLVLDSYSGEYGSIPKEAAQQFAELLRIQLEKSGVQVSGITVDTDRWQFETYWKQRGF